MENRQGNHNDNIAAEPGHPNIESCPKTTEFSTKTIAITTNPQTKFEIHILTFLPIIKEIDAI